MCQPHPDRPFRTALIGLLLVAAGIDLGQYVEDSIDVGGTAVYNMAHNPAADVVYGTSWSADRFFAVACSSNLVVSSFTVCFPRAVVYDSVRNKAYCTYGPVGGDESLLVVDGASHRRVRGLRLNGAACPLLDVAHGRLYVSGGEAADEVAVVDCVTDSVTTRIPVGRDPGLLHLNTLRRKLYVQNYDEASVSIVDLTTNQVIRTIPLGSEPQSGCYVPSVDRYYSDGGGGGRVVVVDGTGDSVRRVIPLRPGNTTMSMSTSGSRPLLMVGTYGDHPDSVFVIDATADSVVEAIPVGRTPRCLLWSGASDLIYCANGASDNASVLRGDGSGAIATLRVGDGPVALAASDRSRRVYVGHANTRMVYVIRNLLGVADELLPEAPRPAPVFVVTHGVLHWTGPVAQLSDIAGRGVAKLRPGSVGIAGLSPGVYFVVTPTSTGSIPSAPQKVVITR